MLQVKPLVHGLFSLIQNNSTAMLATASVGGLTATALLSAKAAPQALDEIYNKSEGHPENVDLLGKIRMTWKIWLPPISVGALTVVCIVAMNSTHLRRQAALASDLGFGSQSTNSTKTFRSTAMRWATFSDGKAIECLRCDSTQR